MQNVIPSPVGYTRNGVYSANARSNVMAAGLAAEAEVFHFRHNVTDLYTVIREVRLYAFVDTTGFTAGGFIFRLSPARSWTVAGTGGNTIALTGDNSKLRTEYPTTRLTAAGSGMRVADTGALGAGTKTKDANGITELAGVVTASAFTAMLPAGSLLYDSSLNYPLVLGVNEGFVIGANVPATGTWRFGVSVLWEETKGYPR